VLLGGTTAILSASNVGGDVDAGGFSSVQLVGCGVDGRLTCESAAEAVCEDSRVASVSGCARCTSL
jgi:hypothetical protein